VSDEMKKAYLIHGSDRAKVDQARNRLRTRALDEAGSAGIEVFEPEEGRGSPDAEALATAIGAMSLMPGRRYLLADGIEKWGKRQAESVCEAIGSIDDDTSVVLISRGKVPAGIEPAIKKVDGVVLAYEAPKASELPARLIQSATAKGFELEPEAARFLVAHFGDSMTRLENELDRLALWAGPEGRVELEDLEEMLADLTEMSIFALGDSLIAQDLGAALAIAERLLGQGSTVPAVIYPTATAVRRAHRALSMLEAGEPPKAVERELKLPSFLVRKLFEAMKGASPDSMRAASIALADLEVWTRGGREYPEELALDLALVAATANG
jgi:DNA polymerase-3 subunit delta